MNLDRINRYLIEGITKKNTEVDIVVMERDGSGMTPIERISDELDTNLKSLEKNKSVSIDILMDFRRIHKDLKENIVNTHKGIGVMELNEKMYGFGKNGTVEVYGSSVIINKNGRSVEMTKQELIDILLKLGVAKKKAK